MDISKIEDHQNPGFNPFQFPTMFYFRRIVPKPSHPSFFQGTSSPSPSIPSCSPLPQADWGLKTVGTLVAADHLGRVLSAAGQLEEAEEHLRRAVDGLQEARKWEVESRGFW